MTNTTSCHDSTELAHVWQPRPPRFDANGRAPASLGFS
jgi:hypothetical protein